MAGKADIKAGGAFIRLFVKDETMKGLKGALAAVGTGIAKAAAGIVAIGAAAGTAAVAAAHHFANVGSELADMSARTGVAASTLAELKFAAEQTGASLDDVEKALRHMAKEGMSADDFDKMAEEISRIADPSEKAARAMEVWGKAGTKLLPMLEDLAALRAQARDLGLAPTDEEVSRADAMGDSFDKLKGVASAAWFRIGASASVVLQPLIEKLAQIIAATTKWVSENEFVTASLKRIGDALTEMPFVAIQQKLAALRASFLKVAADFWDVFLIEGDTVGGRLKAALKDQAKAAEDDVNRLTMEMLQQRGQQAPGQNRKSASDELMGNQARSAFSAGGAVALQWAGAARNVAARTLEEIRAMKKLMAESLRVAKEAAARRDRPGIFRNN